MSSFIVSLDFELHWGVRDKISAAACRAQMLATRGAIPRLLDLFEKTETAATWATVGLLFAESRDEASFYRPKRMANYAADTSNPYSEKVGESEKSDPIHYAPTLIRSIAECPRQEIASHTFSHYLMGEPWADADSFEADLNAARSISEAKGFHVRSLVFPRNQINRTGLRAAHKVGFQAYRANPESWEWRDQASVPDEFRILQRAFRLSDSFLPLRRPKSLSRHARELADFDVVPQPATRFLRPIGRTGQIGGKIKKNRIFFELFSAAKRGVDYHLWWHPHNFGRATSENLELLQEILEFRLWLDGRFGFRSETMLENSIRRDGPSVTAS